MTGLLFSLQHLKTFRYDILCCFSIKMFLFILVFLQLNFSYLNITLKFYCPSRNQLISSVPTFIVGSYYSVA